MLYRNFKRASKKIKSLVRVLQITHYSDFHISPKSDITMGDTSQQRSGKQLFLVLTWVTSFKVQSGFRQEFETEAGTGRINPFVFNVSDRDHVPECRNDWLL